MEQTWVSRTNQQAKMRDWIWKSDSIKEGKFFKQWFKSKHSPFLKKIYRPVIWNLTFEIVLQDKHIIHALVMSN